MSPHEPRSSRRRRLLRGVGASLVVGIAGCADAGESNADDSGTTERPTTAVDGGPTVTDRSGESPDSAEPTPTADRTGTDVGAGTGTPVHADYETTEVRVIAAGGGVLGSVTAAIADTPELRYRGLGDTESLPPGRGMLFVYDEVGDRTFVMRGMDFGIDVVYADGNGTITRIHHAPAPGPEEDRTEHRYPGRGQYVLEVNYGWTTERDVETGDALEFEL